MTLDGSEHAGRQPSSGNWWARNPRKAIFLVVFLFFLLGLFVTERLLRDRVAIASFGSKRFINLREHQPLFSGYVYPTPEDLRNAEFLERKPYLLRVDANGYIMPSEVHAHPDVSLVFLGGSTTECLYMGEEERFPYLVGRLLERELALKVNSYNAGKAGNNSLHSIDILYNKVMFLHPDIVLMMHNVNDLIILLFERSYWNHNPYKSPLVEFKPSLSKNLGQSLVMLRDYLIPNVSQALLGMYERWGGGKPANEFAAVRGEKLAFQTSRLLRDFTANLQIFIDICRQWRITPVLLTMANRFKDDPDPFIASALQRIEVEHGISYQDFKKLFDLFNEQIRVVGEANRILVIDLATKIPQDKQYLYDTVHLTARGASLTSQVIAQHLIFKIPEAMANKAAPGAP